MKKQARKEASKHTTTKYTTVLTFPSAWNKLPQAQPLIYGIPQSIHVNRETKTHRGTNENQEVSVAQEEGMAG